MYLDAVSSVQVIIKLYESELLPERYRKEFLQTVINYAIDGRDVSVIGNDKIRNLLTEQEYSDLISRLKAELLPRLKK